jgi:solute carrier family 39 (zinc transporter), member 1/2/3
LIGAHGHAAAAEIIAEHDGPTGLEKKEFSDEESAHGASIMTDSALATIIGVAILEFGVLLHSILIGLTLAVDANFKILFVVVIFHRWSNPLSVLSHLTSLLIDAQKPLKG